MKKHKKFYFSVLLASALLFLSHASKAADIELSKGQIVYVPAYSHIYSGDRENEMLLSVTLSIRNTDMNYSMRIVSVDYYDTSGKPVKKYLEKSKTLKAMESTHFVVSHSDDAGGAGANFIVKWMAEKEMNIPIIESIMIGTQHQQGISFTSRGQAIRSQKVKKLGIQE